MHEDALRSLLRGIHETAVLNNIQTRNLNRPFNISKYPDGPFYATRRKIEEILIDVGGDEPIHLQQVFIVSSPIGVGYSGTFGHTNKWIVIGKEDMENNDVKLELRTNKRQITKSGGEDTKIWHPRRNVPITETDTQLFSNVQQIEKYYIGNAK